MKTAREILAEKLLFAREKIGRMSVAKLAEKSGASRAWITNAEKAGQNFQIDEYERAILACGAAFEELFTGPDTSKSEHQDLFWMLKSLIDNNDKRAIETLRFTLNSFTSSPRASPSPEQREGQDDTAGNAAEHRSHQHQHKRKTGT